MAHAGAFLRAGKTSAAVIWFTRAAELGDVEAPYDLGAGYEQQGDLVQALYWYTEATRVGYSDALNGVMRILSDVEPFLAWLGPEVESGNSVAKEFLRDSRADTDPR